MDSMRALVRDADGVALRRVAAPVIGAPDDVIVRVAIAGVCRTDLRVADGELGVGPIVLGHECAGTIAACGPAVVGLSAGDAVTVVPVARCGDCAGCAAGAACHRPRWLGVDRDGGFAELVRVPAACLHRLPPGMPMRHGAYVEPVAAALGVLHAGIARDARVLVSGDNRIAELTARVLVGHGVTALVRHDPARDPAPPPASIDVAVESTGVGLDALVAALRPGGTLILKSRGAGPTTIDPGALVARELTVRGLGHGSFAEAIAWIHDGRIAIEDLLAPPRPLEDFAAVFAAARRSEARKLLFTMEAAP